MSEIDNFNRVIELEKLRAENRRLTATLDAITEPGKASGIVRAVFEFAESECGHKPHSARHGLSSIKEWVAEAKAENARLTAEVERLKHCVEVEDSATYRQLRRAAQASDPQGSKGKV